MSIHEETLAQSIGRIERLGKSLFGVTACVIQLHAEDVGNADADFASQAHRFCAQLPLADELQIFPATSSPFSPALGRFDNVEVRFAVLHPVRDGAGNIVGRLALMHERSRAFTAGDRHWLADFLAVIERELHFSTRKPI